MASDRITVVVDGVRTITRALQLMSTETRSRCRAEVEVSLDEAVAEAKSRVPKRTGELDRTIRKKMAVGDLPLGYLLAGFGSLKRRSRAKTGAGKKRARGRKPQQGPVEPGIYAMVDEFGDAKRNKPAQPYIVPAVESVRPRHQARIAAALRGAAAIAERSG